MKSVTSDVLTVLGSRNFYSADLYTITPLAGPVLYYTSADINITANGHTYLHGGTTGPFFDRASSSNGQKALCHWKAGLSVDTLQFDVIPKNATVLGTPFLSACRIGLFDGADFRLERYVSAGGLSGTIILFDGRIGEIDAGRSYATFIIADHRELLNQNLPRNLYAESCLSSFCDQACGLNRASFTKTSTAASGSTKTQINTGLTDATGTYDLGSITFTSGPNSGLARGVKAYTNGSPSTITMIAPFPYDPGIGDTFSIFQGCVRTTAACNSFGNIANFRGVPFTPAAENSG